MAQIEPIQYLSCTAQRQADTRQQSSWKDWLDRLTRAAEREKREQAGFLRLRWIKTGRTCYYHRELDAIVGDLSDPSVLEHDSRSYAEEMLDLLDQGSALQVGSLPAGVLTEAESLVFRTQAYQAAAERLGWVDLTRFPLTTIRPLTLRGEGKEVCWLPVFRCAPQWKLPAGQSLEVRLAQLFQRGLVPAAALERCPDTVAQACRDERCADVLSRLSGGADAGPGAAARPATAEETEQLKQYFLDKPYRMANLPSYEPSIFQASKGSWDLYPFVGLTGDHLPEQEGPWYQVSGLFARDPREDVASDSNLVAIDFGTKSTIVAIFDGRGGNITVIPMGRFSDIPDAFENPTILKFCHIEKFLRDYRSKEFQPDTEFNDLVVSHQALHDYEGVENAQNGKNMLQYLQHLKQWAGSPGRSLVIQDQCGTVVRLDARAMEGGADTLNPVELYAYYIGLYINNMHQGRIYLKYLLSYSATYLPKCREAIRAAFERGLKKSLPEGVGRDAALMQRFSVRLWLDEATAYAVCALSRVLHQAAVQNDGADPLLQELESGEVFYGTYDFGGGTLDFSMGTMRGTERMEIRKLGDGGGSHLGCENILEEMAFRIFCDEKNRKWLISKGVRCNKPMFYGMRQGEERIVGASNAARYNTCNLVCALRRFWKGEAGALSTEGERSHLWLEGEDEKFYTPLLGEGPCERDSLILWAQPEAIEQFFRNKVMEGVRLFVDFYRDILRREERLRRKKLFVFLAGNASRAPRVRACMEEYLREVGLSEQFVIQPPLPTDLDKRMTRQEPGRSIPTAKSGVVFGLLLARPGTEMLSVVDDTPRPCMRYCIGQKKLNWNTLSGGDFQLLARPDQMMQAPMPYRRLRRITQSMFELLYTEDKRYAVEHEQQPITDSVRTIAVQVAESDVGLWLYGRVSAEDPEVLELGASNVEGTFQSHVERFLGVCRFGDERFVPAQLAERVPDAPAADAPASRPDPEFTVTDSLDRLLGRFRRSELRRKELELGRTDADAVTFASEEGKPFTVELPHPGQDRTLRLRWFAEGPYEVLICGESNVYRLDLDRGAWEELS